MDGNDGDNNCENIEKCEIIRKNFFKTKTEKTPPSMFRTLSF